jgi:hypothetical protein
MGKLNRALMALTCILALEIPSNTLEKIAEESDSMEKRLTADVKDGIISSEQKELYLNNYWRNSSRPYLGSLFCLFTLAGLSIYSSYKFMRE